MKIRTPELTQPLKKFATSLGFDLCGIALPQPYPFHQHFQPWIDAGKAGDMTPWMARNPHTRTDPTKLLPEVKSIIVLTMNYFHAPPLRRGKIAKYALGKDYHDIIPPKLKELDLWLQNHGGTQRPAVDTSPILEKPAAVAAGIGWQGKSTMLIHPRKGTYFFLAELLTTLELTPDPPIKNHCGTCTRCIDICPTQAITAPYQLDARKCIAYLTIEHKGSIPEHFRPLIGDHLYGCDDCLDICPWNRWAKQSSEPAFDPIPRPDLREMLAWDDPTFRKHFRHTPIFRLKRPRWLRNIAIVLGNTGSPEDLPALRTAAQDPDPLIHEHASWAITQINLRHPTIA